MAETLQVPGDRDTNVAAMPGDQNAHATMISLRFNGRMHWSGKASTPLKAQPKYCEQVITTG
jgi:hypothetical protein